MEEGNMRLCIFRLVLELGNSRTFPSTSHQRYLEIPYPIHHGGCGINWFRPGRASLRSHGISQLSEKTQEIRNCVPLLRKHRRNLATCEANMLAWSSVWDSDGKPGDWERYREVWQEYYDEIVDGIADMVELSGQIDKRFKRSMSVRAKDEINLWMGTKRLARKIDARVVQPVAMALFDNQALQEQIERLTRTVESVKQLSEHKAQRGSNTYKPGATTSVDVDQTLRLQQFMRSLTRATSRLYEKRTEARGAHHWALDLRLPDEYGNVKEWDCTSQVVIDFTFELHPPTPQSERRLRLAHARFQPNEETDEDEIDWQQVILGQVILPQITVSIQEPPVRKSRRFRELFNDGFFDHPLISQAWEQDRARLVLALVNWALLLWDTNWTSDICSHGLRFVRSSFGTPSSSYTLTVGEHDHCSHHAWKLRNLGLVLVEIILATPLRSCSTGEPKYEKWSRSENTWVSINREDILRDVGSRSKSLSFRDAVRFCLDERSEVARESFHPSFLLRYIESVFEPVEKWCKVRLGEEDQWFHERFRQRVLRLWYSHIWPEAALMPTDTSDTPGSEGVVEDIVIPGGWNVRWESAKQK